MHLILYKISFSVRKKRHIKNQGVAELKTEFLKSFVAVVESKSFSAAAKRLFLSQPAISKTNRHMMYIVLLIAFPPYFPNR